MRAPRIAAAAALLAALAACGASASPARRPAPVLPAATAAPLPPLALRLQTGEPWTAEAARGRVLLIDVWATYCKPCRKAFPKLGRLAAEHPGLVVVGVSVDEDDAAVAAFLREVPAAFLIARDPDRVVQSGPLAVQTLPTVLVVDRRGRIRYRADTMAEADYDDLPGIVSALLAE